MGSIYTGPEGLARNPDFSTLAEASYEAADKLLAHLNECCIGNQYCGFAKELDRDYQAKKDAALKAIRAAEAKQKRAAVISGMLNEGKEARA